MGNGVGGVTDGVGVSVGVVVGVNVGVGVTLGIGLSVGVTDGVGVGVGVSKPTGVGVVVGEGKYGSTAYQTSFLFWLLRSKPPITHILPL